MSNEDWQLFQSTPCEKGDKCILWPVNSRHRFNPRACTKGDSPKQAKHSPSGVFQSTPLRGRRGSVVAVCKVLAFQSTPLREGRLNKGHFVATCQSFNPRPAEGRHRLDVMLHFYSCVSITPLRRRRGGMSGLQLEDSFNPRLRRATPIFLGARGILSFNPRPCEGRL